jgi:transketolase
MSHHATEDMAILRALPDVAVFTPGDPAEVRAVMPVLTYHSGTCYLRLGRGGEPTLHQKPIENYRIGQGLCLKEGSNAAILSAGGILSQTVAAAEILEKQGISAGVYSFPTLKPLDEDLIRRLAGELPLLVTVEENTILGGLGGAVAETVGDMTGNRARVMRLGMRDAYSTIVGSQQYLREQYGLDFQSIADRIIKALKEKKP